jgi:hypothetical protein
VLVAASRATFTVTLHPTEDQEDQAGAWEKEEEWPQVGARPHDSYSPPFLCFSCSVFFGV